MCTRPPHEMRGQGRGSRERHVRPADRHGRRHRTPSRRWSHDDARRGDHASLHPHHRQKVALRGAVDGDWHGLTAQGEPRLRQAKPRGPANLVLRRDRGRIQLAEFPAEIAAASEDRRGTGWSAGAARQQQRYAVAVRLLLDHEGREESSRLVVERITDHRHLPPRSTPLRGTLGSTRPIRCNHFVDGANTVLWTEQDAPCVPGRPHIKSTPAA